MALDNFSDVDPTLPRDVYQEIDKLKQEIELLARTLDSVMAIAGGKLGIGGAPGGSYLLQIAGSVFAQGLNVSSGGGVNSANTATFDTTGAGIARFYSRGADAATVGGFQFRLQSADGAIDTLAMSIASTGRVSVAGRFDLSPPAGQVYGVWESVGAAESYLQLSVGGAIYGYIGNGGALGGSVGRLTLRGEQGVALNLGSSPVLTVQSNGSVVTYITPAGGSLDSNSTMTCALTSNTNLRFLVRGTDGVTRQANLTLT
jgi:hypothetical protein